MFLRIYYKFLKKIIVCYNLIAKFYQFINTIYFILNIFTYFLVINKLINLKFFFKCLHHLKILIIF